MKRKFLTLCLGLAFAAVAFAQQGPKYVFYFIGDGMGVNQVNATETYLAAVEGRRGIKPLTFPSFPNVALVNTQSDSHGITDSAAGGTALATGRKTCRATPLFSRRASSLGAFTASPIRPTARATVSTWCSAPISATFATSTSSSRPTKPRSTASAPRPTV